MTLTRYFLSGQRRSSTKQWVATTAYFSSPLPVNWKYLSTSRPYRRALIDYLTTEDIARAKPMVGRAPCRSHRYATKRNSVNGRRCLHNDVLEDMADYYSGQARANGYTLGKSADEPVDKLAELAKSNGYETVEEYLDDAAGDSCLHYARPWLPHHP